jgi:hypothetical protein
MKISFRKIDRFETILEFWFVAMPPQYTAMKQPTLILVAVVEYSESAFGAKSLAETLLETCNGKWAIFVSRELESLV